LTFKILLLVYFTINVVWGIFITVFHYNFKGQLNSPSNSIESSKKKGVFVKELSALPSRFIIENNSVEIKEVWVENVNVVSFVISVIPGLYQFPIYTKEDRYNVCVTFLDDKHHIPSSYYLFLDNYGKSFTKQGVSFSYETIDNLEWDKLRVNIRNPRQKQGKSIKIIMKDKFELEKSEI